MPAPGSRVGYYKVKPGAGAVRSRTARVRPHPAGQRRVNPTKTELLRDLRNANAVRRRRAVVAIRKLKDRSCGSAILESLRREREAGCGWEGQYHMIMALGELDYRPAYGFLRELADEAFEATLLYTALGEALLRLGRTYGNDPTALFEVMEAGNFILLDGAFRAVNLLSISFSAEVVGRILDFARGLKDPQSDVHRRYFSNGADPGWSSPNLHRFVARCLDDPCEANRRAAEAVLSGAGGQARAGPGEGP